jgi:hypothetical protein
MDETLVHQPVGFSIKIEGRDRLFEHGSKMRKVC